MNRVYMEGKKQQNKSIVVNRTDLFKQEGFKNN